MRSILFSLLVGLLPSLSFGQSCSESSSPSSNLTVSPGSLSLLPAMHQGETGLCYAFTISQLVDAHRYLIPANRQTRISPLVLGMLTPQSSNFLQRSRLEDGGSTKVALEALMRAGTPVCDEQYLRTLYGDTDDQFTVFATMELMFKNIREAYYTPCNCTATERREDALGSISEMRNFMTSPSMLEGTPSEGVNGFLADLATIIISMNDLPPNAFANYNTSFNSHLLVPYFNRLCRGNTITVPPLKLSGLRSSYHYLNSGLTSVPDNQQVKRFSDYAWNILSQPSAQPVGVSFCSAMLTGTRLFVRPAHGVDGCGNHAAVLAGQRCNAGKRQFLLRNSWGDNCGDHLAPRHLPSCDGKGNVWVDAENLMRSSYSLYQTVP